MEVEVAATGLLIRRRAFVAKVTENIPVENIEEFGTERKGHYVGKPGFVVRAVLKRGTPVYVSLVFGSERRALAYRKLLIGVLAPVRFFLD